MTTNSALNFSAAFGKQLDPAFEKLLAEIFINKVESVKVQEFTFTDNSNTPVVRSIPRFVPSDQYAGSFSFQWSTYTETQLDSAQGSSLTEQDLINKTGLSQADVQGKLVLDAGVGIGRHSEILARWGAYVIGIDLSDAVEAARDNLAQFNNAVVLQADISNLPFAPESFEHIVSIGVLHHTPDTRRYTESLMPLVKAGGRFSIWLYPPGFARRGEWTPLVSQLPLIGFREWCDWIVDVARDNRGNHWLEAFMNQFPFSTHHPTRERSVLALFDGYTPTYHWTHDPDEVSNWFREAGFDDIRLSPIPTAVSACKPVAAVVKANEPKTSVKAQGFPIVTSFTVSNHKQKTAVAPKPIAKSDSQQDLFAAPEKLSKLTMEITTLCNLKCAGCPRTTGIEKGVWSDMHMQMDLFQKILDHLPPVGFVTLHGIGEPTLHPDFNELVAVAKASGKFQRMKMTTNALARSVDYYRQSVVAGLDEFWISVDSLNQEICDQMRLGTKAEKLQRRVAALVDASLPVHISMVVSAVNYRDIPTTLTALYEAGAPPVHMQEFQDFGDPYGLMTAEQRKEFMQSLQEVRKKLPGMAIHPPTYTSPPGDICTAPWFRPAITVQGYFTPCCTTFDPSQFGFVNLGELDFNQAWQQPGVHNWIKRFLKDETEICRGCGLNPRRFGVENVLGVSGKTGNEQHVVGK